MRRRVPLPGGPVLLLAAAAALAGCLPPAAPGPARPLRDRVFAGDTLLEGTVLLAGECLVPRGAVLRLSPGTRVLFAVEDKDGDGIGDSRLRVEGTILAEGRADAPVVFSSAGDGKGARRPGDWDAILLNFSRGNLFRHTLIEYSNYSIHAHFCDGTIALSLIRRNNDGCRLGNSRFLIEENIVRENVYKGLNFRNCANTLRGNEVTANGNGIFIFEKDAGSVIKGNNIYGNERYNFRLDDFFTGEILLEDNWWGSADEKVIREAIYDSRQDKSIGTVILRPAPAPLPPPRPFESIPGEGGMLP